MCVCVCLCVPILLLDHPADLLNFCREDPNYNGGEPDWCFVRFRFELPSLFILFHHFFVQIPDSWKRYAISSSSRRPVYGFYFISTSEVGALHSGFADQFPCWFRRRWRIKWSPTHTGCDKHILQPPLEVQFSLKHTFWDICDYKRILNVITNICI